MLGYRSDLISFKCVGVENALWCKEKLGCRNLKSEREVDDNALFYLNVAKLIISTFLENIVCKSFFLRSLCIVDECGRLLNAWQ